MFFVIEQIFAKYSSVISIISLLGFIGYLYNKFWINRRLLNSRTSLKGKTVLITGGNAGIGYETVKGLLERDARVVIACRNLSKGAEAVQRLSKECSREHVSLRLMQCDLSSLNSVRKFVEEFLNEEERLDILICNAGIGHSPVHLTEDQFDDVIQSNYLGHFLLTDLLREKLRQCQPSRIINVSSELHLMVRSIDDWSDVFVQANNRALMGSYPYSKVFQVLSTYQMKNEFLQEGINVFAMTPGWVSTSIQDPLEASIPSIARLFYRPLNSLLKFFLIKTAEKGAETILYCAMEPSLERSTDLYFQNCRVTKTSALTTDPQIAQRLWTLSRQALRLD